MIDPLLRKIAPAVQTESTPSAPAAAEAPTAGASAYLRDGLEAAQARPVMDLAGLGNETAIELPSFIERLFGLKGPDLKGPKLLHLEDGWTPQGQGYDEQRGQLLTTYYKDHSVLLSIQEKGSGSQTHQVALGGLEAGEPGGPVKAPSHGGGVSTDGEFVYVADTKGIYVYTRAELEQAAEDGVPAKPFQVTEVPEDTVDPKTGIDLVSSGSFMTVKDGYAYVGAYSKDGDGKAGAVWRYELDPATGGLLEDSRQGPIRAPDRAQGMAVVDGALMFTTGDKKLIYQPFDEQTFQADIEDRSNLANGRIDSWAQGFNVIGNELWVTYESGSQKYDGDKGRQEIQRIPLDQLDLEAAGLTPEDLQG